MPSVRTASPVTPVRGESLPQIVVRALELMNPDVQRSGVHPTARGAGDFDRLLGELRTSVLMESSEDAVDVLFNFALGEGQASQAATHVLLEVAGDSRASDEVRALIAECALKATENYFRLADASPDRAFRVPAPLLWLALREAPGSRGTNARIGAKIFDAYPESDLSAVELSSPNRYCGQDEILVSLGPHESSVLSINDAIISTNHLNFSASVQTLGAQALQTEKPQAAILQHGAHWVALVVCPVGAAEQVDVAVYDSLHSRGDADAGVLKTTLCRALGDQLGNYTHAGGNVQGNTNGCGPLCVRALRGLRTQLESGSGAAASSGDVVGILEGEIYEVGSWPQEKLESVVTGLRAQMLYALQHSQDFFWDED